MSFVEHIILLKNLRQLEPNPQPVNPGAEVDFSSTTASEPWCASCGWTSPPACPARPCSPSKAYELLQDLSICVCPGGNIVGLRLLSRKLVRLAVLGNKARGMDPTDTVLDAVMVLTDLLPATTPVLPHVKELRLCGLGISDFPAALAVKVRQLTSLDLSHNRFPCLPAAISLITSLNELHCRCNPLLELEGGDIPLLASLLHLSTLDISKHARQGCSIYCDKCAHPDCPHKKAAPPAIAQLRGLMV